MHPFFRLSDSLEIPSYFLVISLVLCCSLFWLRRRADRYHVPPRQVLDLSLVLMLSCMIGARLFHVFYEAFDYYLQYPMRVFYLWQGGFVFYGGALSGTLATLLYFRVARTAHPGVFFDIFAPVLAFGYGTGRIGCFLEGCCYGKFCSLPWAVNGRHPTQLYATIWESGVVMILLGLENIPRSQRPNVLRNSGDLFLLWMVLHALGRIVMESLRDDDRGPAIFGASISTAISFLILAGAAGALWMRRSAPQQKPS